MKYEFLESRLLNNNIDRLDLYFAGMMARICHTDDVQLINLFASLSHATNQQHTSLLLSDKPELVEKLKQLEAVSQCHWQSIEAQPTPLVLVEATNGTHLFLQKYFQLEARIAAELATRNYAVEASPEQLAILDRLFPKPESIASGQHPEKQVAVDWQKIAAYQALSRNLTIISGGPGTGKTSTVVKILAAICSDTKTQLKPTDSNPGTQIIQVKLAAPTGKAAMRLADSIKRSLKDLPEALQDKIPTEVQTLHRLIGVRPRGEGTKYHRGNPINADLLILDEASMIDLLMFDRILAATAKETRIIILGDPGQLPAVEVGAVLGDICEMDVNYSEDYQNQLNEHLGIDLQSSDQVAVSHKLTDARCHLEKSYRFSASEGIGQLAEMLKNAANCEFTNNDQVKVVTQFTQSSVITAATALYKDYFDLIEKTGDPEALMSAFEQSQILCPMRQGNLGVYQLNEAIEAVYQPLNPTYYPGKPIMVNSNDYKLRLFNGDIGICVMHQERLQVAFKDSEGRINYFLPSRLPQHETCFVMTVHKSQGSEFNNVMLILPTLTDEETTSRELIYTAVTRTIEKLTVFSHKSRLDFSTNTKRVNGLSPRLVLD